MNQLIKNLPPGEQGRSIHSPRTITLMKYEQLRRRYNRVNKASLSLVTFLHLHYSKRFKTPLKDVCLMGRLVVEIVQFDKAKHYLSKAKYFNNKKTRL